MAGDAVEQRDRSLVLYLVGQPRHVVRGEGSGRLAEGEAMMGDAIHSRFDIVDDIPTTEAGKFKFVVSDLASPWLEPKRMVTG